MTRAEEILQQLLTDLEDPTIANSTVAVRAGERAREYFEDKGHAFQKRSPKTKVSRASSTGKNEPKDAGPVGEADTGKRETTRSRQAFIRSRNA